MDPHLVGYFRFNSGTYLILLLWSIESAHSVSL
jgi:hypothetical protein